MPTPALLLALLAAAPAPLAAAPDGGSAPGELLIWSGASSLEAATAQKEQLGAVVSLLRDLIAFQPEVVESAKVPGLKPGFFVVTLGLCSPEALTLPQAVFHTFYPGVYSRTVTYPVGDSLPSLTCPVPGEVATEGEEPEHWQPQNQVLLSTGKVTAGIVAFHFSWAQQGDFAQEFTNVHVVGLAVNAGGTVLDTVDVYDAALDTTALHDWKQEPDQVHFDLQWADPRCDPSGDHYVGWRQSVSIRLVKGKLKVARAKKVKLDEGSCGFAEEGRMISGEHGD